MARHIPPKPEPSPVASFIAGLTGKGRKDIPAELRDFYSQLFEALRLAHDGQQRFTNGVKGYWCNVSGSFNENPRQPELVSLRVCFSDRKNAQYSRNRDFSLSGTSTKWIALKVSGGFVMDCLPIPDIDTAALETARWLGTVADEMESRVGRDTPQGQIMKVFLERTRHHLEELTM